MSAGSSSSRKKSGSKPKGAVRAKSGCYTCRIRRKKCDENPDEEGSCRTCVRLRLQCLGFGAKRPEWMRQGNNVAEMREKIKTFLAQNGMIKGHSARSVQPLAVTGPSTSSVTAEMSPSTTLHPAVRTTPTQETDVLDTPVSATSTLTPDRRSDSSLSPPSSHASITYSNNHTFPPDAYNDASARLRRDVMPTDIDSGVDQDESSSSASGVLVLSADRPVPTKSNSISTSRNSRRCPPEYGLGLIEESLNPSGTNRSGAANDGNNSRYGPRSTSNFPRSANMSSYAHPPPISYPCISPSSRFSSASSATSSSSTGAYSSGCSYTHPNANTMSNMMNLPSPTTASTSSSPPLSFHNVSFTPYTPANPLPALPHPDEKSDNMDWIPGPPSNVYSPIVMSPTDHNLLSPHAGGNLLVPGVEISDLSASRHDITTGHMSNNGMHAGPSDIRVKTEPDTYCFDFENHTADGSNALGYGPCGSDVSMRHHYPAPVFNHVAHSTFASAMNNYPSLEYAEYNNINEIAPDLKLHHSPPTRPNLPCDFAPSTSMATRPHTAYPAFTNTGYSSYHRQPELSPDSPAPRLRADPMMGQYAPTSASHLDGQSTMNAYAHHSSTQFPLQATHGRHSDASQTGFSGFGHGGHGYDTSHGYGNTQPTSSWSGDNNVQAANHHYQEQLLHHPQPPQAQVQPQGPYVWYQGNHTNDSGELGKFHASPTVRRPDLPPPSIQSSFSPLYNAQFGMDEFPIDGMNSFVSQQAPMDTAVSTLDQGALMPYCSGLPAPISDADFFSLTHDQQQQTYQFYAPLRSPHQAPVDPQYVDRGDGSLVEHYLQHVRPVQYFFLDERVVGLLRNLAFSNEAVRNAICSVASVHKRRMREGNVLLYGGSPTNSPIRSSLAITMGAPDVPEGDDGNTYYNRIQMVLAQASNESLTKAHAMAGLQCISSFLFAGGVGQWDFFLNVARRWVESVITRFRIEAGNEHLLDKLARWKREDELGSFIVRATMWFEVLASVTMICPPKFLDIYRILFSANERARIVEIDGETARSEEEFSMLEVMGCDNPTFLALAEISALAAWKEGEEKNQTLSYVELVKRGHDIEQRCLRPIAGAKRLRDDGSTSEDSLENRRRLTADIFRTSARLYLNTVLNGDNPSVKEIREGVAETIEALRCVPIEPISLRRSVVRSVVFPICLAGCMTDNENERVTVKQFLEGEGGAGNCGSVVAVMETVWERRDKRRRGGRRAAEWGDVSWREVLREHGGGVPILLV